MNLMDSSLTVQPTCTRCSAVDSTTASSIVSREKISVRKNVYDSTRKEFFRNERYLRMSASPRLMHRDSLSAQGDSRRMSDWSFLRVYSLGGIRST